jgi:hypothetical protein
LRGLDLSTYDETGKGDGLGCFIRCCSVIGGGAVYALGNVAAAVSGSPYWLCRVMERLSTSFTQYKLSYRWIRKVRGGQYSRSRE